METTRLTASPHPLVIEGVRLEPPPGLVARIWERDPSAWGPGEDDPAQRLGWLELPETMRGEIAGLEAFARQVAGEADRVVLLGMGGSSLAPEMYARTFGWRQGHPSLTVLDSTHPAQVASVLEEIDPGATLVLVSSKSGTTLETLTLYRRFREVVANGARFAAITDPGSPLHSLAEEEGFRKTFLNPPDIGGRYSALSFFGLVPAALIGADLGDLLSTAAEMARATRPRVPEEENPALLLGTALAALVREGRDKLTFLISDPVSSFGDWVEQLLAESTGKRGTGVVPVVAEPQVDHSHYGEDRAFVHLALQGDRSQDAFVDALAEAGHPVIRITLPSLLGLGGEIFAWELATAVAGSLLGINAFDQPDVESAKSATRQVLEEAGELEWAVEDPGELVSGAAPGDYVALLAFAPATEERASALSAARRRLLLEHGVATTANFGPRYLHSTGQLHKGGPAHVRALVVLDEPREDESVPGEEFGFARLVHAQAVGDAHALREAGRPIARTTWERFARWIEEEA